MKTLFHCAERHSTIAVLVLGLVAAPAAFGQIGPSCSGVIPETIGMTAYRCASCSAEHRRDGSVVLLFDAEPVVAGISPSTGTARVQVGDVIVSVNGKPITTRDAGVTLSNPPAGTLQLGVRRNGSHVNLESMVPLRCTGPGGLPSVQATTLLNRSIHQDPEVAGVFSWQDGVARLVEGDVGFHQPHVLRSLDSATTALRASFRRFYMDAQGLLRMDAALGTLDSAVKAIDSALARLRPLVDTTLGSRLQMPTRQSNQLQAASNQLEAASNRMRALVSDQFARIASTTSNLGFAVACVESCSRLTDAGGNAYWRYSARPIVSSVREQGPAERAGLRAGDTISEVDGRSILTDEGAAAFQRAAERDGGSVRLTVIRDGRPLTLLIQIGGR